MKLLDILSVDVRDLPRENTRSAMTRWPCEYTGRCVESAGYNVPINGTTISLWQSQRIETFASPGT